MIAQILGLLGFGGVAATSPAVLSVTEAHEKVLAGDVLLVDVRTPQEWAATGLASGAQPLMLQDPQFLTKLDALTSADRSRPVAFICRSGNRSGMAQSQARKAGYDSVFNVVGGMEGQGGWLDEGLPVRDAE